MLLGKEHQSLMTAVMNVRDQSGQLQQERSILDSIIEASFITGNIVKRPGIHTMKMSIMIVRISTSGAEIA
jgi:hypothetical protein